MAVPFKQARFNPLRVFTSRGPAITVWGTNRYTGQPVNNYGLTQEAHELLQAILAEFPDSPTKRNFAVDRNMVGSATLSDHARGEALDMMVPRYDSQPGVSEIDRKYGDRVAAWLDEQMTGPVKVGLRGKRYVGPYRISYWVWNGDTHPAGFPRRRLKPSSLQHYDHVHISIVPVDRASKPIDVEPRRTLRKGMTGDDVRKVQRLVGVPDDGKFGPITDAAVRSFQKRHGLFVDGVVGPQTWRKIDEVSTG